MKPLFAFLILATVTLSGCKTNDFEIVGVLHAGMSREEARSKIAQYGFERRECVIRPSAGWSVIETSMQLPKRAEAVEKSLGIVVGTAEYYPVYHGMMGFGELFLFYDTSDRLADFYRVHIN